MDGQSLYKLCLSIADDADETFQSKSDWATALQMGYASYVESIAEQLPSIYEKPFDFTMPTGAILTWTGTPTAGNVATLTINATTYTYVALLGDTMVSVANALTILAIGNTAANVSNVGAVTQVLPKNIVSPSVTATFTPGTGSVVAAVASQASVDLNGVLFGPTPSTGDVLYKITKMHNVNVGCSPDFGGWVQPATSMDQLWAYAVGGAGAGAPGAWGSWRYMLQGTRILFSCQLTQTLRLYYIPSPTIDWNVAIASPGVFIDNTPDFAQQAIAFYAYQYYAIKDFQQNPVAQQRFAQIMQQISVWVARGRNGDAARWVQPGRQRSPWGA